MRPLVALTLLATAAGCSATVVDDVTDEPADATIHGVVVVERTVALATAPRFARSDVYARFLRVSGGLDAATASEVVGAAAVDAQAPLGCSGREAPVAPVAVGDGAIELLDVGDMVLHVIDGDADHTVALAARAFPDVGELVSGVVYTSRDDSAALPAGGSYVIETSGSDWMDGFAVQVDAPGEIVGLRLAGLLADEDELVVEAGLPLTIAWEAGAIDDRIVVDVSPVDDAAAGFRCVFEDRGVATVPTSFMAFAAGNELDVIVHRVRETSIKLPGVDEAVVAFDYALLARVAVGE